MTVGPGPGVEGGNIEADPCKVKRQRALTWLGRVLNLPPSPPTGRTLEAQISDFILAFPMLVFAMVAHEYAHAAAPSRGRRHAYSLGRVTLNPLPHIDPWMSLLLPALLWFGSGGQYTFGGAKPVPVNSRKFRNFRRGDIIVSAAGVTTNLFLAGLFACCSCSSAWRARCPGAMPALDTAQRMMVYGIWLNLVLCFFNLIPIPPLDGSHLLYHALPPRAGRGTVACGASAICRCSRSCFFSSGWCILLTPAFA